MEPKKRITEEWFEIKRCDGHCCFVDRDPVIVPKEETPEAALPPSPGKTQLEGARFPAKMLEDIISDAAPGTTVMDPAACLERIEAAQIKATTAAESATGENQGELILERLQRVEVLLENLLQRIG